MVRLAALLVALLAPFAAAAQQPAAATLAQLQRAPDEELVRLFFGAAATFPHVGYREPSRFSVLSRRPSLWFYSRARADYAGVCRTDRLVVSLDRVPGSDRQNPSFRPRDFALHPIYIVENRAEAFGTIAHTEQRPLHERDAACDALDPQRGGIPADNAFQLVQALRHVEALGEGARAGRAIAPLDCSRINWNGDPPADEAACLRALSVLREHHVGWIRQCPPRRPAPGGCIQVLANDWWIEFDLDPGQEPIRVVIEGVEDMSQSHLGPA